MKSGQTYEFAARTVEAAVDEGLRQMGVSRDQVDVEVLHEGSRGILGIGASDAQVRLSRKSGADSIDSIEAQAQEATAESAQVVADADDGMEETLGPGDPVDPVAHSETPAVLAAPAVLASAADDATSLPAAEIQDENGAQEGEEDDADLEDLTYDLLSQMLQKLGIEAEIELSWLDSSEDSERSLNLNVVGDELGILIGRNGETLASIQYLVRLMVNQELHRWKNIVVDIDGYKQRRAMQLDKLAHRLAEQVVASGRPVSLEPMPANERRLVHIALRNHEQVYTASTGEDDRRKVQILPK